MTEPAEREPNILILEQPTRTDYVTKTVNVHEHRAPTDASVKLLREMEAKAEAEVINAVVVGDTAFECVVHEFIDDPNDRVRMRAIFKLNGRAMNAEHSAWTHEAHADRRQLWLGLRDEVAKVIATQAIERAFTEAAARRGRP